MKRKILIPLLALAGLAALGVYSMGWLHQDTSLEGSGTVEALEGELSDAEAWAGKAQAAVV